MQIVIGAREFELLGVNMKERYEGFTRFFEEPTREGLRELLQWNFGEQDNLDFKRQWPSLAKVAKHILAFANSGGGCIVLGVEQPDGVLEAVGLDSIIDKADISKGVSTYLPEELEYTILDFNYTSSDYDKLVGKKFQVIIIEDKPEYIPFVSKGESAEVKKNTIYVRMGTNTINATYEDIQRIVNRRIETGYSSTSELNLEQHFAQLKILYENIRRYKYLGGINAMSSAFAQMLQGEAVPNKCFPSEDFEQFINRMIDKKKKRIEKVLNLG